MKRVGIIGVTGYAGQQLLWILAQHPNVEIAALSSRSYAGQCVSEVFPSYAYSGEGEERVGVEQLLLSDEAFAEKIPQLDLIFLALPHGLSQPLAKAAFDSGVKVVDLGADFRFDDALSYEQHYNATHSEKDLNGIAVYGLPELNREQIKGAPLVASPGCYPTSAILGLAPLIDAGVIELNGIIVDAKSGTTGAGRGAKTTSLYCEVNENFKAYGVLNHRHRPEIEEKLTNVYRESLAGRNRSESVNITFTPHLLPCNRGILSTIYATLIEPKSEEELYSIYRDFYQNEPFVRIQSALPELHHVTHTNLCDIGLRVDERGERVVIVSVIDNLIKGAAGQAVQNMNLLFGFNENEGLTFRSMTI